MWPIGTVASARDARVRPLDVSWDEMADVLTRPIDHAGPPDDPETKRRIPGWIPARFRPTIEGEYRRKAEFVDAVSCLVLDLDSGEPPERARDIASGHAAVYHTSWSHTPEHPKGRLTLPFASPCPVDRWGAVWASGARWAASRGLTVDPATKDPCRLFFVPAVPVGDAARRSQFASWAQGGDLLSWRDLLVTYPPPPVSRRHTPIAWTGGRGLPGQDQTSAEHDRRCRFARAVVETRAREISGMGQGGRNVATFRAGAAIGQLAAAGVIDENAAAGVILQAAMAAGLDEREARDAIKNGLLRGAKDGPWIFTS